MVMDFKYHTITVIVIFISLAIGILIGSSMVGDELIIQKQQKLISNLEGDFTSLRRENVEFSSEIKGLKLRLEENKEFQKMILPVVVNNQLQNKNILLVVGDNISKELKQKVVKILELADVSSLKISNHKMEAGDFDRLVFLGERNNEFNAEYTEQIINVKPEELQLTSSLIRFVLQLAAKDLECEQDE